MLVVPTRMLLSYVKYFFEARGEEGERGHFIVSGIFCTLTPVYSLQNHNDYFTLSFMW